ncbi:MAG TPA: tetratricopeptide repeat protein [Candidatus Eisenbacteria bacterium]
MNPAENVYRPCPCGSGQKYKFCCLSRDRDRRRELRRETPHVIGPDGRPTVVLDLVEGEQAHQLGLKLVEQMRAREAIPYLERAIEAAPIVPQPYNNLAMAHFLEGDPEKAIEICGRIDRAIDPGNVFALGNRIHFLMVLGRRRDAEETGQRILGLPGRDGFAVYKKCEALARLRWHDHVYDTATQGLPRAGECVDGLKFFAGTAAANLARYDEAERYLRQARSDRVHARMARRHLDFLGRRRGPGTLLEDWPYLEWGHWVSPGLLERMKGEEEARKYPGMVEALICLLNEGEEGDAPLRLLGLIGTPEAFDALRRIAFGTFGSDKLRMMALSELQDRGETDDHEPLDVWLEGRWHTIRPERLEVTTEIPSAFPEDLRASMASLVEALRAEDWGRAEALGRELVDRAPGCAQALHNLAVALAARGRNADAEDLLRRAIAADATYLFAPASLARLLLQRNRTAEARAILKGVRLPNQAHPDGYALYLLAQAEVALVEGDFEAAARAWEAAESVAPQHPAVREVGRDRGRPLVQYLAQSDQRHREALMRQRTRLLPRDAGLDDCMADYTRDQLREIAATLGLGAVAALKKVDLLGRLITALGDPEVVRQTMRSLPAPALKGLRHVWVAGWVCAHDDFTRVYGRDLGEDGAPSSLALLRPSGLLAEGTVGGQPSVLIPAEVRPTVEEEFSSLALPVASSGPATSGGTGSP